MLTMTERVKFAQTIADLNLEKMSDDNLRANLASGKRMLDNPKDYYIDADNSILLRFWIVEYEKELKRRELN